MKKYYFGKIIFSKGPVTGYGKLTWEFAHAWNFMKLCALIVLVMTAIIMVYSLVNSIPLANYDVIYDVTTIAKSTHFKRFYSGQRFMKQMLEAFQK